MPSGATDQLALRLGSFRAAHPPRELMHEGVRWRYNRGGRGEPVVLLLTGALGVAAVGFAFQEELERDFTVLAPDYPAEVSAETVLDGLIAILDAERVGRVVVHGGSFGGLIAQRLVERAPHRVSAAVLSHTGPVEAARVPRLLLRMLRRLPERWLLASYRRRLAPLVAAAGPFWRDWVDRTLAELGKGHLLARIELADDLARLPATRHPRGAWSGPTLLLEASDDPAVRPAWRGRLRARFPTAGTHRFEGAGHVAALIDPAGFARVVRDFIRRAAAAAP